MPLEIVTGLSAFRLAEHFSILPGTADAYATENVPTTVSW